MSSSTLSATYIFNQYYIDLLKKVKVIAKKHRLQSETAKKVLKAIKDNYHTYDKTSSDGQISKTCSDIELLKYLPNFEFTPFSKGLYETISFFKHNYRYIRK